ncbi:Meiotic coiled-coil protein 2 [Cyphellophora attinorum]|uniref:Meiotic coiled-coil protein 2 n=1 Tax=Cyphellophora attinorum TaxID=1664694 RepID=A0A0N1NZU4_9EURO|nr:Meiotic coiled-coil protein 2 [Phialophora attinorum]KPI37940.1 Meiotic coiled-coil protein 2 [Phialophora attinorum]
MASSGSPRERRGASPSGNATEKHDSFSRTPASHRLSAKSSMTKNSSPAAKSDGATAIRASRLQGSPQEVRKPSSTMEDILANLKLNDSRKMTPKASQLNNTKAKDDAKFDKLVANLQEQNDALKEQGRELKEDTRSNNQKPSDNSSSSGRYTESFAVISSSGSEQGSRYDIAEMLRIKQELHAAKTVISRQEQELAETRNLKHTMEQAIGSSEHDYAQHDISEQTIGHLQSAFNASARPFTSKNVAWRGPDKARSDSDFSSASMNPRNWEQVSGNVHGYNNNLNSMMGTQRSQQFPGPYQQGPMDTDSYAAQRSFSSSSSSLGYDARHAKDMAMYGLNPLGRRNTQLRGNPNMLDQLSLGPLGNSGISPPISPLSIDEQFALAQQASMGLQPSPVTPGFPAPQGPGQGWLGPPLAGNQTYVTPLEPMNYRRLLDKSVSCDWKYIVDKIVCNNDQQASIFLQQKLKVGTAEQKFDIVEAIVNQAYPLMVNRFGNFLVQRCFEHGTPEQVVAIAEAIHGNVIALSMDPFGCHVIQKAFDSVPEEHKADMVRELLRRIPDTVIHRYACHVWQKLFELRWSGEPPQIMVKVNEALQGMWHEVALGETGSLVVQNIFENCVEEEKRPAIEEVITNIDLIAHGQFGNWCIQHLCEHGSPPDKRRVIDHILTNSYNYSIDQFASKVVEKCLKISGMDFLDRYLGVITTARPDRPRIPLIDIAGDQYGNYLIQWILMNAHHHQREQVAVHIRKHMVSLRGSKFGSRVAMLCCNPGMATRPGPAPVANPYGAPGQSRNGWTRGFRVV